MPKPMAEDDSMNDRELLGVASPGGPPGVSEQDGLVPPQPMDVAMMDADSASNPLEKRSAKEARLQCKRETQAAMSTELC